jgi:polyhydroxyalkanoate synthesis regulator phasin
MKLAAGGAAIATAFATGGISVAAGAIGDAAAVAELGVAFVAVNSQIDKYKTEVGSLPNFTAPDGVLVKTTTGQDISLPTSLDDLDAKSTKAAGKTKKAAKAVAELSQAGKLAQAQMAKLSDELSKQNSILDEARSAYNNFKSGVSSAISGIIDFGQAATAETGTFLENLVAQAAKAADFGSKVKKLLAMGLSETALQQVLSAGADAGTKIADEIIAGGATVVDQVNKLIESTQTVADAVGEAGAQQFYQAGITQGEALVQGVKDAIAAAGFIINASGAIVNQGAINLVNETLAKYRKSGNKLTKKEKKKIADLATQLGVDIPAMAAGGIVTRPTLALIGEAGPEAVVPLNRNNTPMGTTTYNINVNAGMGSDGAQIGREIVDAIKRYERTSGPVFASA